MLGRRLLGLGAGSARRARRTTRRRWSRSSTARVVDVRRQLRDAVHELGGARLGRAVRRPGGARAASRGHAHWGGWGGPRVVNNVVDQQHHDRQREPGEPLVERRPQRRGGRGVQRQVRARAHPHPALRSRQGREVPAGSRRARPEADDGEPGPVDAARATPAAERVRPPGRGDPRAESRAESRALRPQRTRAARPPPRLRPQPPSLTSCRRSRAAAEPLQNRPPFGQSSTVRTAPPEPPRFGESRARPPTERSEAVPASPAPTSRGSDSAPRRAVAPRPLRRRATAGTGALAAADPDAAARAPRRARQPRVPDASGAAAPRRSGRARTPPHRGHSQPRQAAQVRPTAAAAASQSAAPGAHGSFNGSRQLR